MSSEANVYTSVSNVVWQTDRCQISTGSSSVTYNVLLAPSFADSIFSAPIQFPPYSAKAVYVGVGNKITITGSGFTATEFGTRTSGTAGVNEVPNT